MSWTIAHVSETGVPREACCNTACRAQEAGALDRARARVHNDEMLLSRQARELAEAAGLVGALESALARARAHDHATLAPPTPIDAGGRIQLGIDRAPDAEYGTSVTVEQVTVLPTVYTNIGSLLDVFA